MQSSLRARSSTALLALMCVCMCLLVASGCARRFKLTPQELARLDRATNPDQIFAYSHKRFIVIYELDSEKAFELGRTVKVDVEKVRPLVFVDRTSAGQIIARDESNGVPRLWVSFRKDCNDPSCAYGFVRTEDNLYKLAFVPERAGYKLLAVYRKSERPRNKMKKGKVKALGEANEVYLVKRKRRVKTVHLDVKKRIREDEVRTIEEEKGR
jgi:hypothetical protein